MVRFATGVAAVDTVAVLPVPQLATGGRRKGYQFIASGCGLNGPEPPLPQKRDEQPKCQMAAPLFWPALMHAESGPQK